MKKPPYWLPILLCIMAVTAHLSGLHVVVLGLAVIASIMIAISIAAIEILTQRSGR